MSTDDQNMSTEVEFLSDFFEPVQQTKDTTTGYSVNNSLSSSQNRICEDSGIYSNSMHFPTSSINSEDLECLNNFTSIDYDGEDLLDNSDFELVVRNRCNTWPALHPTEFQTNDSSLMRGNIPEENILYGQNGSQVSIDLRAEEAHIDNQDVQDSHEQDINLNSLTAHHSDANSQESCDEDEFQDSLQKRSQTRRNAWGDMSYADLIAQAIMSSPEQRLTLSEIYCWMVDNVPYFSDKGESTSSTGWKNSIRHNLSLHNRFMRVQNEGTGKSSWWIINPETKTTRNPRRRATMDAITKSLIDKKRRGAKKRVEMQSSTEIHQNRTNQNPNSFRPRTLSNISNPGNNQISPTFNPNIDEFNSEQSISNHTAIQANPCYMNQTVNCTDQICLDSNNQQAINQVDVQSQSAYHQVLKDVRSVENNQQASTYHFGSNRVANQNWEINDSQQMNDLVQHSESQNQKFVSELSNMMIEEQVPPNRSLPKELDNLNKFVPSECDLNNTNEIIQQKLLSSSNFYFRF